MSANIIQVNYDELKKIAGIFDHESADIQAHYRQLNQHLEGLRGGDWVGQAATAFYSEMDGWLLPSLQRLSRALEISSAITLDIMKIFHEADAETAHFFNGLDGGESGQVSGEAQFAASLNVEKLEKARASSLKDELIKQNSPKPDLTDWLDKEMKANANSDNARRLATENIIGDTPLIPGLSAAMKVTAYDQWKDLVGYGKEWDFKVELNAGDVKKVMLAGYELDFDTIANIHYGYVGVASGFSSLELVAGAGVAQMIHDGSIGNILNGNLGDPARDRAAIDVGIWLREHPDKTLKDALDIYHDQL
jgi:WXG100 family type VII secretion target